MVISVGSDVLYICGIAFVYYYFGPYVIRIPRARARDVNKRKKTHRTRRNSSPRREYQISNERPIKISPPNTNGRFISGNTEIFIDESSRFLNLVLQLFHRLRWTCFLTILANNGKTNRIKFR